MIVISNNNSFLEKVNEIILDNLANEDFSGQELAKNLCLSRSQLYRRIKAQTNTSTNLYIRLIRLEQAKELLLTTDLNISEIAYRVGFKTAIYFTQIFKESFGESPSEFRLRPF